MNNVDQLATVLANAFHNDPLFAYFFPDANKRQKQSFHTFKFILKHALVNGAVQVTAGSVKGASIALPSEKIDRGLWHQLRFGALRMLIHQSKESLKRQIAASEHMRQIHHQQIAEPHLYLSIIGIEEAHRGQGLATELLTPLIQKSEQLGKAIYLDTHNENNVSLYHRYGFDIVHQG